MLLIFYRWYLLTRSQYIRIDSYEVFPINSCPSKAEENVNVSLDCLWKLWNKLFEALHSALLLYPSCMVCLRDLYFQSTVFVIRIQKKKTWVIDYNNKQNFKIHTLLDYRSTYMIILVLSIGNPPPPPLLSLRCQHHCPTTYQCENNRTVSVFVCVGRTYGIRKFRLLIFVVFLFFGTAVESDF